MRKRQPCHEARTRRRAEHTKFLNMHKITATIVLCLCIIVFSGCSSLHAYMYILVEDYDGNAVLKKEKDVKYMLEQIIENAHQYTIIAYTRTAISYKVKKTNNTTHSFYVIMHEKDSYMTLSFSATGKWATSKGAWAMNTVPDISSYEDYLFAKNRWHLEKIETNNGINTLQTIASILARMESNTTYYFRAKTNKNNKVDNCNTALLRTMVED